MKNRLLHIFFLALAALFCLCSCGLEEPIDTPHNSDGYVEFVARPTSYNKHDVATKAGETDPIEDVAYNAFLLIFDEEGQLILRKQVIPSGESTSTTSPSTTIPVDKGLSTVTACYLINVPHSFVNRIEALTMPSNSSDEYKAANYNKYVNTAVLEGLTYKSGTPMGVPLIDVDNNSATDPIPCLPMFGKEEINLRDASGAQAIPVKRLFAKVTINLQMNLNLDSWTQELIQTGTYYQLNSYTLYNLPNKVKLSPTTELNSDWIMDEDSFEYTETAEKPGNGSTINKKIYNNRYVSSTIQTPTELEFFFYAPEYFLDSGLTDGDQKLKPTYCPSGAYPIRLTLNGTYCQYSVTSAQMHHFIYLGRNGKCDFTLERNKNYINYLTIAGTKGNNNPTGDDEHLDHRVSTEYLNNPVAESGQSANCYVIGKTGNYAFPAYKGAYNDLTKAVLCNKSTAKTLEEIANDNPNNIKLSNLKYDSEKNLVSFTIDEIDDGNVVIALKNNDNSTEWSWHLWCTSVKRYDIFGWGAIDTQDYSSGSTFMDRNLGATESTSITSGGGEGLTYKYGSKNPYIGSVECGGGVNGTETWYKEKTISKPDGTTIKKLEKTEHDPCPPGYMVPPEGAWGSSGTHLASTVVAFGYEVSIYYPYVGGRTTVTRDIIATGWDRTTTKEQNSNETPSGFKYPKTRTQTRTQTKIFDVEYSAPMVCYTGNVWTSTTQKTYFYDYNMVDFTNLKAMINDMSVNRYKETSRSVTVTQTKSSLVSSWKDDKTPTESDWSSWSTPQTKEYSYSLGDTWPLSVLNAELAKEDSGIYFSTSSYSSQNSTELRFPLRCMQIPPEDEN